VKQAVNNKEQTRELLQRASVKAIRSLSKLMQDEEVARAFAVMPLAAFSNCISKVVSWQISKNQLRSFGNC
jgi:hypothetical protein